MRKSVVPCLFFCHLVLFVSLYGKLHSVSAQEVCGCVCSHRHFAHPAWCLASLAFLCLVCWRVGYVTRDRPTPPQRGWEVGESAGHITAWLGDFSHQLNDHDVSDTTCLFVKRSKTETQLLRPPVGKQPSFNNLHSWRWVQLSTICSWW